jgi:hypothetical protein
MVKLGVRWRKLCCKRPLRELGWQRDYRGQVRSHFFGKWEKLQNLPAPRRLPRDKRINPAAVFH